MVGKGSFPQVFYKDPMTAQIGIARDSVPLGGSQSVCESAGMVSVHWPGIPWQFNWKWVPSVSEIDISCAKQSVQLATSLPNHETDFGFEETKP